MGHHRGPDRLPPSHPDSGRCAQGIPVSGSSWRTSGDGIAGPPRPGAIGKQFVVVDLGSAPLAAHRVHTREGQQSLLPSGLRLRRFRYGTQAFLGFGQKLGGRIEAHMTDLFEPIGQDMLDQALEEGHGMEADRAPILAAERGDGNGVPASRYGEPG